MLCEHLQDFTPVVISLSANVPLLPAFEDKGIRVVIQDFPRNYRFKKHAAALKPTVDSLNPSIIHSSLFHADMTLRYLETNARKVSGLVSTMYSDGRLNRLDWITRQKIQVLKFWDQRTTSRIDLFIANSNSIRNLYLKKLAYPSEKVKVIFRGRQIPDFCENAPRRKNQISFIGRLIPSKGLKEAIEAFGTLSKNHPDMIFKIAGQGPSLEDLKELARSHKLGGKVVFLGQIDYVLELLAESSFFIFPSHYEGLPGALIEAMLAKIPIICSDIPENRECVDESMCLFHKVGDREDLLSQMKRAIELEDWEVRTQKAFDFATEHFDVEKIARQYEAVYQKLLSVGL